MMKGDVKRSTELPQHGPPHPRVEVTSFILEGWKFEAAKGCISGRSDLETIEERLHGPPSLPEMCFGANRLVLEHQDSGAKV